MKRFITPEDASKLTSLAFRRQSDRAEVSITQDYESELARAISNQLVGTGTKDNDAKDAAERLEAIARKVRPDRKESKTQPRRAVKKKK